MGMPNVMTSELFFYHEMQLHLHCVEEELGVRQGRFDVISLLAYILILLT